MALDGLLTLLLLCIVMGVSSFLAGLLPLTLTLSPKQLRLITALGTGVLVGTSLIVIIPEGIDTLYGASGSTRNPERSVYLAPRSAQTYHDPFPRSLKDEGWQQVDMIPAHIEIAGEREAINQVEVRQDTDSNEPEDNDSGPDDEDHENHKHSHDPHAWVGISLAIGFILMYVIDTLPRHATNQSQPKRFHISLNSLSLTRSRTSSIPETPTISNQEHDSHASRPSSTTLGLVIHGVSDGIALGASSSTTSRLTFIIFVALMIHKAPAAFGLTSVLLKQGVSKRGARAHLAIFSAAAPVGALVTWTAAHLLGYNSVTIGNNMNAEFATGVLLLFSAGTFLYVAMHTMQDGPSGHDHVGHGQSNGYANVPMSDMGDMYGGTAAIAPPKSDGGGVIDMVVTIVGMLLPLLTQFGHAH